MCDKAILENGGTLKSVSDCQKNQKMCNKVVDNYSHALEFLLQCYKTKKCVIKLLILILLQQNLFLNASDSRLKKCVIKQLIGVFLYLILFLIVIKLKKCVTEFYRQIHFYLYTALINI